MGVCVGGLGRSTYCTRCHGAELEPLAKGYLHNEPARQAMPVPVPAAGNVDQCIMEEQPSVWLVCEEHRRNICGAAACQILMYHFR